MKKTDCIDQAERFLALREHNRKELSDKLSNKGFEKGVIEETLDYLTQKNELSEERYVRSFIRSNNKRHPEGMGIVLQRLSLKGADKTVSREVALEMYTEEYISSLAEECFSKLTAKTSDVQKIKYKMAQAGFSLSVIREILSR